MYPAKLQHYKSWTASKQLLVSINDPVITPDLDVDVLYLKKSIKKRWTVQRCPVHLKQTYNTI